MRPISNLGIPKLEIFSTESWSHNLGGIDRNVGCTEMVGLALDLPKCKINRDELEMLVAPIFLMWLGTDIICGRMAQYFWWLSLST